MIVILRADVPYHLHGGNNLPRRTQSIEFLIVCQEWHSFYDKLCISHELPQEWRSVHLTGPATYFNTTLFYNELTWWLALNNKKATYNGQLVVRLLRPPIYFNPIYLTQGRLPMHHISKKGGIVMIVTYIRTKPKQKQEAKTLYNISATT